MFCAKAVADQLNRGIFETYLGLACVPVIPEPMTSSKDRLCHKPPVCPGRDGHRRDRAAAHRGSLAAAGRAEAQRLCGMLRQAAMSPQPLHSARKCILPPVAQAFPVTEEVQQAKTPNAEFHVLGVIERNSMLRMLQHGIGVCSGPHAAYALPADRGQRLRMLASFEQRPLKSTAPLAEAAILE